MKWFRLLCFSIPMLTAVVNAKATTQSKGLEILRFNDLAQTCAPNIHFNTMQAIARTESSFNPYAIGVVNGSVKQPNNLSEAVQVAQELERAGKNFSMGLVQINKHNLQRYDLNLTTVFDPCKNLKAGSAILTECFSRAPGDSQDALQRALSCYYSGNFLTGFRNDLKGQPSYVERIKKAAVLNNDEQLIKSLLTKEVPEINVDHLVEVPVKTEVTTKEKPITMKKKISKASVVSEKDNRLINEYQSNSWDVFADW